MPVEISSNTKNYLDENKLRRFSNASRIKLAANSRLNAYGCRLIGDEDPTGKQFILTENNDTINESAFTSSASDRRTIAPWRRFSDVFSTLAKERRRAESDETAAVADIPLEGIEQPALEFLAYLDRIDGADMLYFREDGIRQEIQRGMFDTTSDSRTSIKDLFDSLTDAEQRVILRTLVLSENDIEPTSCLEAVLVCFFSDTTAPARLYADPESFRMVFCTPMSATEENIRAAALIERLFGDVSRPLEFVWGSSCGILEHNYTMHMNDIVML